VVGRHLGSSSAGVHRRAGLDVARVIRRANMIASTLDIPVFWTPQAVALVMADVAYEAGSEAAEAIERGKNIEHAIAPLVDTWKEAIKTKPSE